MSKIPVIFLAFANDRVDDSAYLRNLPKELHGIRQALEEATKAGLCEVVERANATIDSILDVFQDSRYRDRIAIFHYGGHANGYQLLLENMDGSHSSAHSEGLVSFLGKQISLELVFLNGCSSQQQALDLVNAGLPAVIGTSQSINDDVATMLSTRFYQALGNGANIERAWAEAVDQAKIQKGTANMRDLFWEGSETDVKLDRFPWEIYYREGEDLVKHWNLPESAENPLFGLPSVAAHFDLPEQPYRFLQRYSKEHADIFFGRSHYIRDLYKSAIDGNTAPVLLFYGQSGVGKSSMLDAGVFPRLEQSRQVVYIRRDEAVGLLGTLKQALGLGEAEKDVAEKSSEEKEDLLKQIEQLESLKSKQKAGPIKAQFQGLINQLYSQLREDKPQPIEQHDSLKDTWRSLEEAGNQPLIILLDQVEECFTRPNPELKEELAVFFDAVKDIFYDKRNRPQGKLILSYRKEYNPEIKEACVDRGIPREETFLKPLDRKGIIEVVKGLTLNDRLQRTYRLEVEEDLPVIIADDLLEDKESPVAPVLQILLTKLWKLTENEEQRQFSVDRYQTLRKQGILMDDFFHEQMLLLEEAFPEEVASGLALGLLQQYTTKLGTAGTRTLEQLRQLYADRQEVIDRLLTKFKDLYLLAAYNSQTVGLAHDTLAPLILKEFRSSDKPAQRGAIILDNKLTAFRQDPERVIDPDDLKVVEAGSYGMPLFTQKEQELIEKSRANAKAEQAERERVRQREIDDAKRIKRNLRLASIAAAIAILLAIGAGFFYLQSKESEMAAKVSAKKAQKSEAQAKENEVKANKALQELRSADSKKMVDRAKALKGVERDGLAIEMLEKAIEIDTANAEALILLEKWTKEN